MSGGLKKFSEDAKELASDSTALAKRLADKTKELGSGTFAIRMENTRPQLTRTGTLMVIDALRRVLTSPDVPLRGAGPHTFHREHTEDIRQQRQEERRRISSIEEGIRRAARPAQQGAAAGARQVVGVLPSQGCGLGAFRVLCGSVCDWHRTLLWPESVPSAAHISAHEAIVP